MSKMEWKPEYALGIAAMDSTHQEFVELVAAVQAASDDDLLAHWKSLVEHTQIHFENENRWMQATRFAAGNCHATHHQAVLDVMREGLSYGEKGHKAIVRQMAQELTSWFPLHADTMDAALAMHLQRVGFDPRTGAIAQPELLPGDLIHGCGGDACSDASTPSAAAATSTPTPAAA